MSKISTFKFAALALTMIVMVACDANAYTTVKARSQHNPTVEIPIYVGRTREIIGSIAVEVTNDEVNEDYHVGLTVTVQGGAKISKVQAHFADDIVDIPQTKNPKGDIGNPKPGQFDCDEDYLPPQETIILTPVDTKATPYTTGEQLTGAVHVEGIDGDGNEFSAWAGDLPFVGPGKNKFPNTSIATYFIIEADCLPVPLNLPTSVTAFIRNYGPESYWGITVTDVANDVDIVEGFYNGWCLSESIRISNRRSYEFEVTSMNNATGTNPKINYILNNISTCVDTSTANNSELLQVQRGIWSTLSGNAPSASKLIATCIYDEADLNGANFIAAPGQVTGVRLEKVGKQPLLIPVPVKCELEFISVNE